mmetsp:Transcript_2851/g.6712  ORF Transcript_2851/g.6712 Transcript_2851/m.6712 type:complete len:375 (-) Transcript_2851:21-1145(-)
MGNCVNHEMPQPQQRRRRAADSEAEVKSVATTPEVHEEHSPNGYPSDEDIHESKGAPKSIHAAKDPGGTGPPIEEPPLIKRCIEEPTKDTSGIPIAESALVSKEEPDIVVPPEGSSFVTTQPEIKNVSLEHISKTGVEESSDTDSMSSQVSREMEPASLTPDKPAKAFISDSTFKTSGSLFLCLLGLLAGSIVMTQRSGPPDIRSALVRKEETPPPPIERPSIERKGDFARRFLNWVDARDGLCSLDQNGTVSDMKYTLCPPYSSNDTLSTASSEPACNFASWVDSQDKIDRCSLDVDKKFHQVWSKYGSFGLGQKSTSIDDNTEDKTDDEDITEDITEDNTEDIYEEDEEVHGHFDWFLDSLREFNFHGTIFN